MFINYLLAGILDGSFTALYITLVSLYENKSGLRKGAVMWASASKLPLPLVGIGQTFLFSNYKKNGYMLYIIFKPLQAARTVKASCCD